MSKYYVLAIALTLTAVSFAADALAGPGWQINKGLIGLKTYGPNNIRGGMYEK